MLERVWRKENPLTLLVGMQTNTATTENSVKIPLKTGNRTAIRPSNPTAGHTHCLLILYLEILLNSFKFFDGIFRVFYILHLKIVTFYFFLLSLVAFYFFFLFNAVDRTTNTVLNKNGQSGHPCLISDITGKAFSFSPLIIAVSLSYRAFIMWKYVPSIPSLLRLFIMNGC